MTSDKSLLLYTMTAGLGDLVVMGNLMLKIERHLPDVRCLMIHRGNPHVRLWDADDYRQRFFNAYRPAEMLRLIGILRKAAGLGYRRFGLQMAPGSMQGYAMHRLLQRLGSIDLLVDFNLINADIITPPRGDYILEIHLNQAAELLRTEFPAESFELSLPFTVASKVQEPVRSGLRVGIHPWSRRSMWLDFVWPFERWADVVEHLVGRGVEVVLFGRDKQFTELQRNLEKRLGVKKQMLVYCPCSSVSELIATIGKFDMLVSVNTAVVHLGLALNKPMVILNGPSLPLWTPQGKSVLVVDDEEAVFPGNDRHMDNPLFPRVNRIHVERVIAAIERQFGNIGEGRQDAQ
jgi:hypothetical protein